jgi:hypothetical protein
MNYIRPYFFTVSKVRLLFLAVFEVAFSLLTEKLWLEAKRERFPASRVR